MVDLKKYLDGLHQTTQEKLFFVDILNLRKNKKAKKYTIIDFGCGDGTILYELEKMNIKANFIGIELNEKMIEIAKQKTKKVVFYKKINDLDLNKIKKNVIFLCNSVLHECNVEDVKEILNFIKNTKAIFVVRDMFSSISFSKPINFPYKKILSKIILNANRIHLSKFIAKYGLNQENLWHFLMKYTYIDNWEDELEENYSNGFAFLNFEYEKYRIIYDRCYIQEWRRNRIFMDFNIDISALQWTTHRELIIKYE